MAVNLLGVAKCIDHYKLQHLTNMHKQCTYKISAHKNLACKHSGLSF